MEDGGSALRKILLAVPAIAIFALWPGPSLLHAQRAAKLFRDAPAAVDSADESVGTGSFAAPDREILQALKRAQKVLKEHRYGEALEGLTQVLRSGEDYFYQPDRKVPIYKSLKAEARQLLGEMPREGRDLLEVRSGAEARDKLNRAVAAGDAAGLAELSAQWFHTKAGYEATYLLALYQMDHGAPLAGALTLKRLREAGPAAEAFEPGLSLTQAACYYQAGMPEDCRQVLVELKHRLGSATVQLAGRPTPWFEQESAAPAWLAKSAGLQPMAAGLETDRWAMFRGDPSRNACTAGSPPLLNLRWRVPVTDEPVLEKSLLDLQDSYRQRDVAVFSALHPLAIGDVVLMRTTTNVLAVDFHTGKRLWPTRAEEEADPTRLNRFNPYNLSPSAQYGQRIWDDAAYGTLSSDGSRVFVVEGLPLGVTPQFGGFMFGGNDQSSRGLGNKLAAYDIRTGKLQWELGGEEAVGHRDTFFLGPPLPLRGQLFVMAEIKDETRLLALDGATGNLLWSQQLAMVEAGIAQDPFRRMAGVSPSYGDGVLVCPTGAGCVVAIDLATRALLWGYMYSHPGETAQGRQMRGNAFQFVFNFNANGPVPRWLDGTATIVNGRVLLTPAEADALYCLNLADGKPLWTPQPRGEHVYLACVHKGVAVLVGRNAIDAVNVEDGSKAWGGRTIAMPAGAAVCGHGCYAGGQYFLPLGHHVSMVGGEVMAVDLDSGKVLATVKSRPGSMYSLSAPPGNLVCHRGRVISQGLDGVELYYQADAARDEVAQRLAANPDDVEGLTLRGEMFLDAGKPAQAVADFRRAFRLDKKSESHGRTRELLREALLAGLRDDFAAHRALAGEVEPLLDDLVQRATYLRAMAGGFHRIGDWPQAVEHYLKLVDLEANPPLEKVDRSHLARRDRWVQARLGMLRGEGGPAAAAAIDRALEPRLQEAVKETGIDGLKRFLAFFGNQPQAASARAELLERLAGTGRILEAELLMAAAVPVSSGNIGTDRKAQAVLLADMAGLDFRAGRVRDAAACFHQLQQEFAGVPCHAGMTASQWLAAFPDGDALRREVDRKVPVWPQGEVEVNTPGSGETVIMNRGYRFDRLLGGASRPFFTDCTMTLENGSQEVDLRDGLGHLRHQPLRLMENGRAFRFFFNQNTTQARCCGHLLLVSLGTKICALDPWRVAGTLPAAAGQDGRGAGGDGSSLPAPSGRGAGGDGSSLRSPASRVREDGRGAGGEGILWRQDLSGAAAENGGMMNYVNYNEIRPNPFGPVNARFVCFQRKREIVAADPLTGEPFWVRQDILPRSEVFGDEQYVFVLPPDSDEASVYRAIDGQLLGTRKVPRPKSNGNAYYDDNERGSGLALSNLGFDFQDRFILTWELDANNRRVLAFFDPWQQKAVWPSRTFDSRTRVSVVGSEAVGVLEPGGHFLLLALADGRTIADLHLEVRPHFAVTELVVARMGDQYIVLAHDSQFNGNEDQAMQPPPGMSSFFLRRARIHAVDLQGKLAWPAPVDVDHQQFLLSQPGRLPVLLFAGFHYINPGRRGQQMTMQTALVAVDRRNGRIIYDKQSGGPPRAMLVEISGDPAEKTVRIATGSETVRLTFTDKPLHAALRRSSGVKKPSGKLGEALLDALKEAGTPQ